MEHVLKLFPKNKFCGKWILNSKVEWHFCFNILSFYLLLRVQEAIYFDQIFFLEGFKKNLVSFLLCFQVNCKSSVGFAFGCFNKIFWVLLFCHLWAFGFFIFHVYFEIFFMFSYISFCFLFYFRMIFESASKR